MFVTGLVLAAGSSNRMGRPKQLLPFRGETLLDATLRTARACDFDQLVVTLGGAADQIRERVDLTDLHGDKGVWKLLESGRHQVTEVATPGDVPVDVDTSEDYERLLAVDAERASR